MTAPASPPVAVGVDWLEVYAAVRPVLDRHPMIDSSAAHKLDIQAGWIVDALRALASPVSGDGPLQAEDRPSVPTEGHDAAVLAMADWVDGDHLPLPDALALLADAKDMAVYASEGSANVAYVARQCLARLYREDQAPPAASVSPGMETLQASECTKHGEGDQ